VEKRLDFIVANDAAAFEADTNRVTFITSDGRVERQAEMLKAEVGKAIVERAVRLVHGHRSVR